MFGDAWECTYDGELKLQPVRACVSYARIRMLKWLGAFLSIDSLCAWTSFCVRSPSPLTALHKHRQEEVESVHPMTLEEVFQRVGVRYLR